VNSSSKELYDVHTHIGLDQGFALRRWWPYSASAQDLLLAMDENKIDRAVCFPFTLPSAFDPYAFADRGTVELIPGRVPFDRENENLVEEVRLIDSARRLSVLAMFDPAREISGQVKNLEKLVGRVAGLKTQSTVLQSPIRALLGEGREILEFAMQHRLPLLFHTSLLPADTWAQVRDCLDIAAAFPSLRFNLAHSLRFGKSFLEEAATMPNVWIDCSAHLTHCDLATKGSPVVAPRENRVDADYSKPVEVLKTIHAILGDTYMWGSDNPYMSWCAGNVKSIFTYKQEADVLHALPEDVKISMGNTAPRAWLFGDNA
jgi:predicted TIM-barrel fold metal-dependent hydrolase